VGDIECAETFCHVNLPRTLLVTTSCGEKESEVSKQASTRLIPEFTGERFAILVQSLPVLV
jgi:hypothetical protein